MKRLALLLAALVLSGAPLAAQDFLFPEDETAKAREYAIQYHARCLENVYTDLSPDTQADFCGCSAEAALNRLKLQELAKLATGQGPALDNNRIELEIFAPCAGSPLAEMEADACLGSPLYNNFFKTQKAHDAMCLCLAKNVRAYLNEFGGDMAAYIAQRNLAKKPIVTKIHQSAEFKNVVNEEANKCLNKYIYQ